jgi:hypothetical protein
MNTVVTSKPWHRPSFLRDRVTPSPLLISLDLFPPHSSSRRLLQLPYSACCFWLTYVCNFGAVVRVNKVAILKDSFSKLLLCRMWQFIVWRISIEETSCFRDLGTFIIHRTTRCNFPEERNLHRHRSHNVKPHNPLFSCHTPASEGSLTAWRRGTRRNVAPFRPYVQPEGCISDTEFARIWATPSGSVDHVASTNTAY